MNIEETVMSAIEQGKQEQGEDESGAHFASYLALRVSWYYKTLIENNVPEQLAGELTCSFGGQYLDHLLNPGPKQV